MSDDPNDVFEDMDLDELEYGVSDEELQEIAEDVELDYTWEYAGVQCAVMPYTENNVKTTSWLAMIHVEWDMPVAINKLFQSNIWDYEDGWVRVRVMGDRDMAEDEAEWLAEQVVMIENDPNFKDIVS